MRTGHVAMTHAHNICVLSPANLGLWLLKSVVKIVIIGFNDGKWTMEIGDLPIQIELFHSYVELPEGTLKSDHV